MTSDHFAPQHRFYGRLRGHKLRAHQARLMQQLLPRIRLDLDDPGLPHPSRLFAPGVRDVWLEIGFGSGEHLVWQAQANPHSGLIGAEPFINGVAKLLCEIDEHGIQNVRIHDRDVRDLLPDLESGSIGRAFVLFPDPWPKRRHHKRRIINAAMLSQLHRLLKPGAQLRFASDIPDYVDWTLIKVHHHGGFDWPVRACADWRVRPGDWPATRYEAKALREGRTPAYLTFIRKP